MPSDAAGGAATVTAEYDDGDPATDDPTASAALAWVYGGPTDVTISSNSGKRGKAVVVKGTNYTPGTTATLSVVRLGAIRKKNAHSCTASDNDSVDVATGTVDETGGVEFTITADDGFVAGYNWMCVTDSAGRLEASSNARFRIKGQINFSAPTFDPSGWVTVIGKDVSGGMHEFYYWYSSVGPPNYGGVQRFRHNCNDDDDHIDVQFIGMPECIDGRGNRSPDFEFRFRPAGDFDSPDWHGSPKDSCSSGTRTTTIGTSGGTTNSTSGPLTQNNPSIPTSPA